VFQSAKEVEYDEFTKFRTALSITLERFYLAAGNFPVMAVCLVFTVLQFEYSAVRSQTEGIMATGSD
jgi:hypothetical protein